MDADREIEGLYALPTEEFTAARNELARRLGEAGQSEDAARVKKLKRPPLSAWAVNRLARDERPRLERLLELVDELRDARSADAIHALGAERRDLVAALTRRAGEIMEEAGHSASATTLQRVAQTLQAGGEEEEARLLRAGILSHDLAPSGFDAFGELGSLADMSPPPAADDDEVQELRRIAAEAEEEAARLTEEAERAEAAAIAASEAASEARRRARAAREKAQKAARSAL